MTGMPLPSGPLRRAVCRHCGAALIEREGGWISWTDGSMTCIEAWHDRYVLVAHAPMPPGLKGAPWPLG